MKLMKLVLPLFLLAGAGEAQAQIVVCLDADGDGYAPIHCGGSDCDDTDPRRFPGNVEVCDAEGLDEDCDPTTFGQRDQDGDGFIDSTCTNVDASGNYYSGNDCDDHNRSVHPNATEVCNGIDDNCDAAVDDGVSHAYYVDSDGDGFADSAAASVQACAAPAGYTDRTGDCDDALASIVPGAQICDPAGTTKDLLICQGDQGYVAASCGQRQRCLPQPNGLGVCVCKNGIRNNGNCR